MTAVPGTSSIIQIQNRLCCFEVDLSKRNQNKRVQKMKNAIWSELLKQNYNNKYLENSEKLHKKTQYVYRI